MDRHVVNLDTLLTDQKMRAERVRVEWDKWRDMVNAEVFTRAKDTARNDPLRFTELELRLLRLANLSEWNEDWMAEPEDWSTIRVIGRPVRVIDMTDEE